MISLSGIAVAVTAMICVLSAFNGFQGLIGHLYSSFDPQIKIKAVKGKTFIPDTEDFAKLKNFPEIEGYSEVIEENALAKYKNAQTGVLIKGVDSCYSKINNIGKLIFKGRFTLKEYGTDYATIGAGIATILGTGNSFLNPITIMAPGRNSNINMINPISSFNRKGIMVCGKFGINQPEYDNKYIIVPISFARSLFEYNNEVSSIEIRLKNNFPASDFIKKAQNILGKKFTVMGIKEQKADFYRINKVEKWITFLMLSFILIIALFNVVGTLSMLMIEKKENSEILKAMGIDNNGIGKIFTYEGFLITFSGTVAGIITGCILCMLQQKLGLLKMGVTGGNYIVKAYPVILQLRDVIIIFITALLVGIPATILPVKSYIKQKKKISLLIISALLSLPAFSQINHGGEPVPYGYIPGTITKAKAISGSKPGNIIDMPAFNADSAIAISKLPGNKIGGRTFAHKFFVNYTPENSGETFYFNDSIKIWRLIIRSKGAYSINVQFGQFHIPDGAKLFLYNEDRSQILGSFTNQNKPDGGEFSISPVTGDKITIEYHEPVKASFKGRIKLTEVNHDYLGLFRSTRPNFDASYLPCIPNVACDKELDEISKSVCLIIINGVTLCTGVLVNNTARDGTPYMLTAAHCLQEKGNYEENGENVVAFFNYQAPRCTPIIKGPEGLSVSGSKTIAYDRSLDFALLKLTEMPTSDYFPYLAGWTLKNKATDTPYTGIHHPDGHMKRYCKETESPVITTFNISGFLEKSHWYVQKWETGNTWAGSSGSPLFNNKYQIIGTLSGGHSGEDSTNTYDPSDPMSGCYTTYTIGDFYSRLDKNWDYFDSYTRQLKHWLDPKGLTDKGLKEITGFAPYGNATKRLSNITKKDSIGTTRLKGSSRGAMFGPNSKGITKFAEHYTTEDSSIISGIYVVTYKGEKDSDYPKKYPIYIKIYKGGDTPGEEINSTILNPEYIVYQKDNFETEYTTSFTNRENYIHYTSPVIAGKDFYIGYEIPARGDSFIVYNAITTQRETSTAFYYDNDMEKWISTANYPENGINTSVWLDPVITPDTISTGEDSTLILKTEPRVVYKNGELQAWVNYNWGQHVTLRIYDLTGRLLYLKKIETPRSTIRIELASNSIYIADFRSFKYHSYIKFATTK